jgi:RNA polymerase sigma-70 factor (ECF subfamily)
MTGPGRSGLDEESFTALFDAHYVRLRAFALRRIGNGPIVDDALAETFAVAWRRREAMPDAALPWLFGVCTRVISNQRRSARRRLRLWAKLASTPPAAGRDPADLFAERSVIGEAFARLNEEQREVLRLVAWDGLTTADAAAVVGCTPATFRVRLHRARNELAKHLAAAGHDPEEPSGASIPAQSVQETK